MSELLLHACRECGHLMEADGSHRCPDTNYLTAREALFGAGVPAYNATQASTQMHGCTRRYRIYVAAMRGAAVTYEGFIGWVAERWATFHRIAGREAPPLPCSSRRALTLHQDDIHKDFDDWLALEYGEATPDSIDPITL